ncbi:hypothetical protein F5148DRAFT_303175 [Russula earlei]|uniref:Uncharacterized protein n=1 Tax=Russula earlei TaxID=71964 RepID=A0ACC0UJW0_9AGAM|nr:hypothetical protein F5148DRAFT_303175 [Russula earlei]
MTRSVFEYYRDFEHYRDFASWIDSPDPSEEELEIPGDLIFGEQLGLEQDDTDNDTYLALTRLFDAWAPNFETPTSGIEGTFTDFLSTSTTSIVALPAETPLMPEPIHTLTSPNAQQSDPVPRSPSSSPSSIDSFPSLMSTSECETEPDLPDVTDTSMRSGDSLTSPPTIEPATTSDRVPRGQSPPSTPRSSACAPQRTACVDTGTLLPASPVPLHIDTADSQPLTSSPAPPEVSSMIEEPPFMTDGRGRVVWSRSGVKHGNSPPAACIHDRTQHTGGDRD